MSPLDALRGWYEEQTEAFQEEIAFLLSTSMFDNENDSFSSCVADLKAWLGAKNLDPYNLTGRVARFRACFELAFAHRFHESGWDRPKSFFKYILTEGSSNVDSDQFHLSPTAFKMLRGLPERVEEWKQVGISWTALREKHLTDAVLSNWAAVTSAEYFSKLR